MQRSMPRQRVLLLGLLLCSLAQLGIEYGEAPKRAKAPRVEETAPKLEPEGAPEEEWRQRHGEKIKAVNAAQARLEHAAQARRMLGDRYAYRGTSRASIIAELEGARQELELAQRELALFYEEARQADVPPGWVSEGEDAEEEAGLGAEIDEEAAETPEDAEFDEPGDDPEDDSAEEPED